MRCCFMLQKLNHKIVKKHNNVMYIPIPFLFQRGREVMFTVAT